MFRLVSVWKADGIDTEHHYTNGHMPRSLPQWGNPDNITLLKLIREDYVANGRDWHDPGFRAVLVHRLGNWRMAIRPRVLRAPVSFVVNVLYRFVRNVYGIELPMNVRLGRRVSIDHQSGIVIHGNTQIGDDCRIRHNTTMGIRRMDDLTAAPILERGVDVGAGAVILGRIRLGAYSTIGANAVVLCDVPSGALAAGVPATIVRDRRGGQGPEALELGGGSGQISRSSHPAE